MPSFRQLWVVAVILVGMFAGGLSLEAQVKRALFGAGESGGMYLVHPKYVRANADGTGEVAIGGGIGWLTDVSGNGAHLYQPTATARLTLQRDAAGRYFARPDGVDDTMISLPAFGYTVTEGHYLAMATRQPSGVVAAALFGSQTDFNNRHVLVSGPSRAQLRHAGIVLDKTVGAGTTDAVVVDSLLASGITLDVSENGGTPATTSNPGLTSVSIPSARIALMVSPSVDSDFYGGIVRAGDPGAHRALVVQWLASLNGVTL